MYAYIRWKRYPVLGWNLWNVIAVIAPSLFSRRGGLGICAAGDAWVPHEDLHSASRTGRILLLHSLGVLPSRW